MEYFNEACSSFKERTKEKIIRQKHAIGLLADKILEVLPFAVEKDENGIESESWEMTVDQIAKKFGARTGSVYEIFHVLESLLLVSKIGLKTYRWNGFTHLNTTLSFLQYIGVYCLNLPEEMAEVQDIEIDIILNQNTRAASENIPQDKAPHILQVIQKFIMMFLVPSRIHQRDKRAVSLSYAAKVIHGVHSLSEEAMSAKSRRLYDIANILASISKYCENIVQLTPELGFKAGEEIFCMRKIRLANGNCARRTTIQYLGPEVQPLKIIDIIQLPDYRREFLYFSLGKSALGIPEKPLIIPRTSTFRLAPVEGGDPRVVQSEGLSLSRLSVIDMNKALSVEDIIYLESTRKNVSLSIFKEEENPKNPNAEIEQKDLWLAILPGQSSIQECFNNGMFNPHYNVSNTTPIDIHNSQEM